MLTHFSIVLIKTQTLCRLHNIYKFIHLHNIYTDYTIFIFYSHFNTASVSDQFENVVYNNSVFHTRRFGLIPSKDAKF